jgi:3',5'-cyclic AMP phosphodiesterase CpdA
MSRILPLLTLLLLAGNVGGAPLDVIVVSDLNGPYGQVGLHPRVRRAVARIIEQAPDLVISTGDMVAGQQPYPKLDEQRLHDMWVEFHRTVTEPLAAAGIPLVVTPGNHDASAYPGYANERAAYARAWAGRRTDVDFVDAEHYPFRFAFRRGGVLFIALDATRMGPLAAAELRWLEGLLAGRQGETTVVFGHLPVWPVAQGRETEFIDDPALLAGANVEVYLSGHHHAYYAGSGGGALHVSQACLGSGPRRLIGAREVSARAFTRLIIDDEGVVEVVAFREPAFVETIPLETLPPYIDTPIGRLERYAPPTP